MQKSKFTKFINSLNEDELKIEIDKLFSTFPEVKQHYSMELGTDEDRKKVYDRIKKDLESKYKTKSYRRPKRPRIQKINTILRDVEKHAVFTFELGEIFLYNVECATKFAKDYQYFSDPLNNVILNSYEKSCLYIRDALMEEEYEERLQEVITNMKLFPLVAREMKAIHSRII